MEVTKNQNRETLKELSITVKPLVESGEFSTINEAIIETLYRDGENRVFKKFREWKKEGKKIIKGSKAFPVWARPEQVKREKPEEGQEEEFKYWPICYLFSDAQVV